MTIIEVADLKVEVERKWIRNIYLRVSPTDARIRISAPMLMSERAIRQFVLAKEAWIRQRLRRVGERQSPTPREYLSGELHYYMGQGYRLQVVHGNGPARVERADDQIILYIREGATKEQREVAMREWYRAEMKALIAVLVARWEAVIGVKARRISIKRMRTIWGSCNHRTHDINFNLELMKKPQHCIEYVVVHELLHIIVRLHNDEFKALLTRYLPDWRETKRELNLLG
jgi:predicted metal-dependent hydrolase